ncbi:MAG: cation:proton antiporter [Promicromonosporaceae bacterium]|nr:cation:proton antiporter [Promicromonosporaceae bacterium]
MTTLALVLAMAAVAPLLCAAISRYFRVPVPVMEMLLGIVIGPGALAIATNARLVSVLAAIGMWCLFYSAGYETDFSALRGKLLATASGAWIFCLLLGIGVGTVIASILSGGYSSGVITTPLVSGIFIGAALVSTGLGTLLPMMRDAGEITTRVGRATISSGIIGQFTPLVALAILVGVFSPPIALLTHILFFGIVASLAYLGKRGLPRFATRVQTSTLDTGGQFGVRMQIATCAIVVAFAYLLGVNLAIGSFGAGVLMRSFLAKVPFEEHLVLDRKIRGVINGVFLPVFFVNAGIAFDLPGLLAQPSAFALIPLFLVLMLVVRGIPGSATLPLARRRRRPSAETQKRPLVFNIPVRAAKTRAMIDDDDDDGVISKHVAAIKLDKKRENLMQATSHTNSEWKFIMSSIFCASGITELRT